MYSPEHELERQQVVIGLAEKLGHRIGWKSQ